jgi:hypothetical protein
LDNDRNLSRRFHCFVAARCDDLQANGKNVRGCCLKFYAPGY